MRWPDGGIPDDDRLADAIAASQSFAPQVSVNEVLRHVRGRRITASATTDDGRPVVVKLFHGPRARGNHRRLQALHDAGLGDTVPVSLGHDDTGRIGLVGYRPGTVLDQVEDRDFVGSCQRAGTALAALHRSGATLDREWTLDDELAQLRNRAPGSIAELVLDVIDRFGAPSPTAIVPSHRDCHPRQLVVAGLGVHWIDLDDAAMAVPGLDVGNMLAHLSREHLLGRRPRALTDAARAAFREAYEWSHGEAELRRWEVLSLARLAGLAESRHRSLDQRDALVEEVHRRMWEVAAT